MPIISYYVKSLPLTHATPAACLCPPCHRFYFKIFVESSCIKCVLRTAYTMYFFQCTAILFYLQSYPTAHCVRVAYKKKYPCHLLKKYIAPVGLPTVGFYYFKKKIKKKKKYKRFGIMPYCHIFVWQNVTLMKETIFKLALEIISWIVRDLLDDGKINGSTTSKKTENSPL